MCWAWNFLTVNSHWSLETIYICIYDSSISFWKCLNIPFPNPLTHSKILKLENSIFWTIQWSSRSAAQHQQLSCRSSVWFLPVVELPTEELRSTKLKFVLRQCAYSRAQTEKTSDDTRQWNGKHVTEKHMSKLSSIIIITKNKNISTW